MLPQKDRLSRFGVLATAVAGASGGMCFGLLVAAGFEHVVSQWDAVTRPAVAESRGAGSEQAARGATAGLPPWLETALYLVATLLGAAGSVGLLAGVVAARRQRRAVAAIRKLGGHVAYGDGMLPRRWQGTFVADYFAAVVSVHLEGAAISDADLACLRGLARLRWLWLGETAVSDAALAHVSRLRRLESLDLSGTAVTDAGMPHLCRLKRLRRLWLVGTQVTSAGVEALKRLRRLELVEMDAAAGVGVDVGAD